jgi:hypothetical protein
MSAEAAAVVRSFRVGELMIGLYPSSTGKPGGKETGHRMSHYIVTGGKFAEVFAALAKTGWRLDLESAQHAGKRGEPDSKTRFTCPACGAKAWGKPDLQIVCIPAGREWSHRRPTRRRAPWWALTLRPASRRKDADFPWRQCRSPEIDA